MRGHLIKQFRVCLTAQKHLGFVHEDGIEVSRNISLVIMQAKTDPSECALFRTSSIILRNNIEHSSSQCFRPVCGVCGNLHNLANTSCMTRLISITQITMYDHLHTNRMIIPYFIYVYYDCQSQKL